MSRAERVESELVSLADWIERYFASREVLPPPAIAAGVASARAALALPADAAGSAEAVRAACAAVPALEEARRRRLRWADEAHAQILAVPVPAQPAPEGAGEAVAWRVRMVCCGHDDGYAVFDSHERAEAFRDSYTSGPGVAHHGYSADASESGHRRAAIIEAAPAPASAEAVADSIIDAIVAETRAHLERMERLWGDLSRAASRPGGAE